jgi:hypothetical protein
MARGETLPAFDLHNPLLSLSRAFGTRLENDSIADALSHRARGQENARLARAP